MCRARRPHLAARDAPPDARSAEMCQCGHAEMGKRHRHSVFGLAIAKQIFWPIPRAIRQRLPDVLPHGGGRRGGAPAAPHRVAQEVPAQRVERRSAAVGNLVGRIGPPGLVARLAAHPAAIAGDAELVQRTKNRGCHRRGLDVQRIGQDGGAQSPVQRRQLQRAVDGLCGEGKATAAQE